MHYLLLILLQKLLLGKAFPPIQYLQILCSLVTSLFIQGWDLLLPVFEPLWLRILVLFAGAKKGYRKEMAKFIAEHGGKPV